MCPSEPGAVGLNAEHIVHFYERTSDLALVAGSYLARGLSEGETALVIATDSHRRAFCSELARWGVDVAGARAMGRLILLDAPSILEWLFVDGRIDAGAFERTLAPVVRALSERGPAVRAYGELVDLL